MEALLTEAVIERMCIVVGIVVFLATMIFGGKLWHNERMIVFCDGKDTLTLLLAAVIPLAGWFILVFC